MILKNKKRALASIAVCLILALFSALAFEALHSGHEAFCNEEDCPVCIVLQIIRANKKTSPAAHAEVAEFISFFYIDVIILSALLFVPATLVKQKVKLVI